MWHAGRFTFETQLRSSAIHAEPSLLDPLPLFCRGHAAGVPLSEPAVAVACYPAVDRVTQGAGQFPGTALESVQHEHYEITRTTDSHQRCNPREHTVKQRMKIDNRWSPLFTVNMVDKKSLDSRYPVDVGSGTTNEGSFNTLHGESLCEDRLGYCLYWRCSHLLPDS